MPLPDPQTFKSNTTPDKIRVGLINVTPNYGSNMIKVLSALEAYWENQNGAVMIQEALLYNLWKVCVNWLKLKSDKVEVSPTFLRRKEHVEALRDEALAQLETVSPRAAMALNRYQNRKLQGGFNRPLQSLGRGYHLERAQYLATGKTGSTISGSQIHGLIGDITSGTALGMNYNKRKYDGRLKKIAAKGFGNLSVEDTATLDNIFPGMMPPVVYMNKVARLKYMVNIVNGLLCDSEDQPILMTETTFGGKYSMGMYVMDKYGNLYVKIFSVRRENYVQRHDDGSYSMERQNQVNHSTLLAGGDVISAGMIHIGYNNRRRMQEAGKLSAIDNTSGHYKPSSENLQNCIEVLASQGVSVDLARVGCRSVDGPVFYWGKDFLAGRRNPWPNFETPPNSFFAAPPIKDGQ